MTIRLFARAKLTRKGPHTHTHAIQYAMQYNVLSLYAFSNTEVHLFH